MLITIWSGLSLGAVYALVALGFTVSLLPSGVFNFGQGAIVVAGTYLTYNFLAVDHLGVIPLIALNAAIGMGLGVLCEVLCVTPLRRRGGRASAQRNELVTTVGISTAIIGAIGAHWGYNPLLVPFHGPLQVVHVLGVAAQPVAIIVFGAAVVVAVGLHFWFHLTKWGVACLAVAEDRDAAMLRGINVTVLSLGGFAVAGTLGALSAIVIGPITYAIPTLGNTLALGGFVAIALGGEGSFLGALCGGLLVGLASALATRYTDANYADLAVLCLLVVTLAVRPTGLGGARAARRV